MAEEERNSRPGERQRGTLTSTGYDSIMVIIVNKLWEKVCLQEVGGVSLQ